MFDLSKIKGVIFDYGGTIDSNGNHWAEVLWDSYQDQKVPVTKDQFRSAYVYAERYLAMNHVIQTNDNFLVLLKKKVQLQFEDLINKGFLAKGDKTKEYIIAISEQCFNFVLGLLCKEKPLLAALKDRYPMVLVSNFYGNIESVLRDFDLIDYFDTIIESAVVGIRKPNPEIFRLGIDAFGLEPSSVVVVGDSYEKDIIPALECGCQTIWLKGLGWGEEKSGETKASLIISDFIELKSVFQLDK